MHCSNYLQLYERRHGVERFGLISIIVLPNEYRKERKSGEVCMCNIVIILDHAPYLGKEEAKDVKGTVKFYRINEFQDLVGLRIVVSHCARVS